MPVADILLDSGVANLVALYDPTALLRVASATTVYLSDIVVGELYAGAYLYAKRHASTKYLDLYDDLRQRYHNRVLHPNTNTAFVYAAISAELRAKGAPIQQNDMWIAALARQHDLTLATLDSDFSRVSGLRVEIW